MIIKKLCCGRLGSINRKFFDLFKKAITFTPIDKIDDFIVNYVCGIKNNVDITSMQENIRHYNELEKQAKNINERVGLLEEIEGIFLKYKNELEKEIIQQYLIDRAEKEHISEDILRKENDRIKFEKETEENKRLLQEKNNILEKINDEIKKLDITLIESDINKKAERLKENLKILNEKIEKIKELKDENITIFKRKILMWESTFSKINNNFIPDEIRNNLENIKDNVKYLDGINSKNINDIRLDCFDDLNKDIESVQEISKREEINIENAGKDKKTEINKLEDDISKLSSGIHVYDSNLLEFKNILKSRLQEKFNEDIDIYILADLLEIRNEEWSNAIEGYLNNQREYLIVEPCFFKDASIIYKEVAKDNKKYHSYGIVDVEKVMNEKFEIQQNSLAEEIFSDNQFAKCYADYLLGRVIKVNNVEEIVNYKIAITPDCMLYQNHVLRKINPRIYEYPFLGKNALIKQKEIKEKKLGICKEEQLILKNKFDTLRILAQIELPPDKDYISRMKKDLCEFYKEDGYISEIKRCEEEYSKLDLYYLDNLRNQKNKLENERAEIDKQKEKMSEQRGFIESKIIRLNEEIPIMKNNLAQKDLYIKLKYDSKWESDIGKPRYEKENALKSNKVIMDNYKIQIEKTKKRMQEEKERLIASRTTYINKYQKFYGTQNNDNIEYDEELKKLRDIELPEYIEKIKDAKEKAYQQFREEFLAKLKSNIDDANKQIKELNEALKVHKFGNDQYIFKVTPKEEYKHIYQMITEEMLLEGYNLMTEQFNSKYKNEIKELFDKITTTNISLESNMAEYEKNIKLYTDYRTYLNFDLIVKDSNGNEQRLSKTLSKKSGGETQTPFYIAMLASFAQLYRIDTNGMNRESTLRLILFDEAFSKMDSDRIEESLKLLRKIGFQVILAAPSEKADDIIPLVDSTFVVIKRDGASTIIQKWRNKEE